MTSPWSSNRGCVYPSCQGGVRNGHFCHSRTSCAHGYLRQLSTHLCEPLRLVQVWLPKRGSLTAVSCCVWWSGPGPRVGSMEASWVSMAIFDDQRRTLQKANCKREFFDVIRHVEICAKGRTPETKFLPIFLIFFSQKHQPITIITYLLIFSQEIQLPHLQ